MFGIHQNKLTKSLPSKLKRSSAAGHSGLLTVDSKSYTKFSNKGRKSFSPFVEHL